MSKKKVLETKKAKERKNNYYKAALAVFIFIAAVAVIYFMFLQGQKADDKLWELDGSGLLRFSERGVVDADTALIGSAEDHTLEKVTYESFGENVYALLRIPAGVSKPPVVVVLPAASINKENDAAMASALCSMGYATLTLDERGNQGETPGPFAGDLNAGYEAYTKGGDPVQYKQVYDALKGLDYIKTRNDLDADNVAIMGESMGGRFAIIAGSLEPHFKAVYVVSSSGYGNKKYDDPEVNAFISSIEPADYLSKLPPRKLIMFHFKNDSIIPAEMGKELFDAASVPKAWYLYDGEVHGLYNDMLADDLRYELKETFGR